ncbi:MULTISPECIES: PLxRFG domain-containing protein [Acinetobacter]|uniref:Uncharacterized protein n=1 Tax=Acinetobacter higginsii TaxID=70347 RepID=N9RI36_9GAMM|nr:MULTISPECIES: PLxRFG domain-containing protein [Acinetobacter]ENX57663.1 hypothetical protein F902_02060 [Acinetobacter higginsii]
MSESTLKPFTGKLDDNTNSKQQPTLKPFTGALDGEEKGVAGHLKDTGLSALKGAVAVPELGVGVMDMMSDGAVGKTLENNDGVIGFRPKEAKQALGESHTDQYKKQQQAFADAGKDGNWVDKVVDKTKVALTNPSLITNTVVESVPAMLAGGVIGRASGIVNPVVAGAVGEGSVMAGSQAEQIRQDTVDGRLTADQSLAGAATGVLGGIFGFAGGRLAQKMGIGDAETMLVNGRFGPAEIAGEIASTPAKSVPRRIIEGAISEGFLEELPQSVSEQILQNLALDKPWSEGVEDAAVMGTLAGMAMGGAANIISGHNQNNDTQDNQTESNLPTAPIAPPQLGSGTDNSLTGEYIPRSETSIGTNGQTRTSFVYDQPSTEADNLLGNSNESNFSGSTGLDPSNNPLSPNGGKYLDIPQPQLPSEQLGINPNNGPMSSAAALAVDSGASQVIQDTNSQPVTTADSIKHGMSEISRGMDEGAREQVAQYINEGKTERLTYRKDDAIQSALSNPNYNVQSNADGSVTVIGVKTADNVWHGISNEGNSNQQIGVQQQDKPVFSSNESVGTMRYAQDITTQALEYYKNDNAELLDRKSSLTGKGPATDLLYYKNSPSFSNVQVEDAGNKAVVKLTNAKTGQITEREYPKSLIAFNDFLDSNTKNAVTPVNDNTDVIANLEQKLADSKSVVKKAQIRKEIDSLKNSSPSVEIEQAVKSKDIEQSANEAATSPLNNVPEPTPAQIEAGNYKKGHIKFKGLDISIENPKGSNRSGKRPDGTEWSHTMSDHYGYIKRTEGADSEQIDTYIGKNPDSDQVFIVDQLDQETGGFDEHKVMLGFDSQEAATSAYKSNFDEGWKVGPIRSMKINQFKDWLKNDDTTKPSVSKILPSKKETKNLATTLNNIQLSNRAQAGYELAKNSGNRIIYSDNKGQIDTADIVVNSLNAKGHEFYLALGTDKHSVGKYKVISEHGLTVGGFHATEAEALKAFNDKINSVTDKQLQEAFERAAKIVQDSGKSQDDFKQQFENGLYSRKTATTQNNQDSGNANSIQTKNLSSNDTKPSSTDGTTGNRNSQPLDDGLAKTSGSTDRDRGVSGRTEKSGRTGTDSVQQRTEPSSGTSRDSGTVRAGSSTTVSERESELDPATAEISEKPVLDNDFNLQDEEIGKGGIRQKYKDNIATIKILKTLELENRVATPEERKQIAQYVGWGALKGVFDKDNKQWSKEYNELKSLLSDAEYAAARASVLNAHYTSKDVVNGIISIVERLGFKSGRVLEPSVGTGNFFGLMPASLRKKSELHGVELDPITSQIVAALYPSAKIAKATGFQDFQVPAEYFDLVIGNPPFGNEPVVDNDRSPYSGFSIHNYFFAKSIDKLRPGGVLAMVVSHNFMDARTNNNRKWIAERADLLAAVRLPNTAFKENAGTEVVTDIIVLRKRGKDEKSSNVEWVETGLETLVNTKTGEESQHHVNNYFINNPKHILGESTATGSMYKANEYTVESLNYPLGKLLSNWVSEYIPENIYQPISRTDVMSSANYSVPDGVKVGSFFINDKGDVLQRGEDELGSKTAQLWLSPNNKALERMKGMIALRDALRDQMRMEKSLDADSQQIEANRKKLNDLYDQFHKNFGYLNSQTNRRIFLDDTESALVQALEFDYDRGVSKSVAEREEIEARPESANKADIFKMRVLFPPTNNIKVYNANDALLASLNYKGKVDLDYMAELYDKPVAEIVSELGESVYNDPIRGMVMADEYLSGDVKTKLEEAQAMAKNDSEFKRNVEALKKTIPKDKLPSEIHATLGASFIPTKIYDEFAQEITGMKFGFRYLKATGQWIATTDGTADPALNVGKWGTESMPAVDILTRTMAGQGVLVTKTNKSQLGGSHTVVMEKETEAAREKQSALKVEWQRWLWADPDRAEQVATIYNEKMNRIVNRKFDGSHLTFPGMNPIMALLPHQKNAVWRVLQDRQVLLDHVVGAGKTFEIVTAFMEMRRLGIARKPFIAVPNHLTLQWRSEFNRLYPGSNILAATPDDFSKGNREKFFSKIITGDWDAVIVGHSSLKKIALPAETEKAVLEEQINEITAAIEDVKRDRGDRNIIRDMENIRTRLQNRMKQRIQNLGDRDKVVTFDELGADAFAVDELHEFKNLFYNTTMQRVPGMGNPKGSDKAFDLFVKLQWMFNTFGNDNAAAIGATGTPVSNSLVEMFNMQRLLQYPTLKANDLHVFDAWAKQFGSVESVYEVSPSGTGFRQSNRFSKFKNLPALMALYNSFADTVTLDDLKAQEIARGKTFPVPKIVGGRPQNVVAKRSDQVAEFMGTPELEIINGQPVFQFDPRQGDTFAFAPQDNGSVSLGILDESGLVKVSGLFATEQDARLALVEYALTPKIFVDEKSILGQFNNLKSLTQQTKGKINALSLTGQANKAGLDYRLINPSAPDFKDSKINKAVAHTLEIYQRWNKDKGTQLIFCDMSIPLSARSGFANKERRIYVRNDGNLTHKKGTMHTVEGQEELPFFVVKEGSGKDKTSFTVYDAVSGMRVKGGMPSKAMAIEQASQLIKNEDSRQTWINAIEQAGEIEQDVIDEYNSEHEIDAEAVESITRDDIAGSSGATQFSVYDDIKAKLIKRGIPEREIAFIHDYNTPSAKEKLFKAVNSGAVRVLLGSTQKMGAGTNVQQRLVALHHIDAPWKPSDLEQREGRIVRRGNRLYERDPENFEVAIYRYATEQTYDTRRWQILEHKARGIEQLRNYDGSLNEIDDIEGEAANAADMKAAASGDPLILEETQLRNEVRRLETLQSAHVDEKQMLRGRIRQNQRFINETSPRLLSEYNSLIETANKHPLPVKDKFVGIKVDGRTINDREKAVTTIQSQLKNAFAGQREVIFNYRGISFSLENIAGQVHLNSPTERMATFDTTKDNLPSASGMLTRFANYIGRLNDHVIEIDHEVDVAKNQIESMSLQLEQPFAQAQDLINVREAHKRVQRRLIAKGPEIPANQKPILEKALNKQRAELEELGLGDTLKEFDGNNDLKNWSRDDLKPDNQRRGASSIDTIFGTLSRNSAVRHVASILDHLKLTTTQDTSTGILRISDKSGLGSFSVQVISSFDGLPKEIQEAATYQDEYGNTQNYVVSGVWHGDTLYLVADGIEGNSDKQITTFEAYQETIIHEVIGHFGVQQIFGNEYKTKFQQLYNALGGLKGIRKIARENGVDMPQFESAYIEPYTQGAENGLYDPLDVQQALVGELFAFVAQNQEKKPFISQKIKEVIGYIRQWFRDRGYDKFLSRYNDSDLMMFLSEARKAVVDRSYLGKYKNQQFPSKINSDTPLYSRRTKSNSGTTIQQARDALVKRFGEDTIAELERQGKLEIIQDYQVEGVEGFYHNGKAVLVASNLTDHSVIPTFLHELGGHAGFQNMMTQKQYNELMSQFNKLVDQGNPVAMAAKLLAERELGSERQHLEYLPYLLTLSSTMQQRNVVQRNALQKLINNLVTYVKATLFDNFGINLNLNPNDIVALAERMIEKSSYNAENVNSPLYSRQFFDNTINNLSESIKHLSAKSIKDKTGYKKTDWLGMGLSALGRRQLTEIYSKILPQLNQYNDLAAQMDADKNDAGAEADSIVRDWANLKDESQLADLMHDATLAKIDPTKPYVKGDSVSRFKQLRDDFNALSPESQAMFIKARDAYKKHYAKVHQAIKERILRSELSSQKKADLLKQMDVQFFGYSKGVYFPLARFGKYVVVMRNQNGEVESVSRAETMGEAQALRSELMQKYPNYNVGKTRLDKEYNEDRDAVGRGFMTSLFAEVDNLGLSTAEQAEFEDTLSQLYLSSMPDLSWAKHGIHRKGTAGFSQDARRAFAQNMFHGAGYLAKLRYGDQLAEQLDDMQKYADEQEKQDNSYDQPTAQRVIDEMNKRHKNLMNPKSNAFSSALTSLGFIYYLGLSPAAAMVNLSQTALVAYPIMGAKWGFDRAASELLKASNDFRKGVDFHKVKWDGTKTELYKTISSDISKFLNKDEKQAYDDAVARGVIDVTQAHDLAGIAQGEDSGIMWKTRPIMRAASVMFHSAERFNREVTFIASYRLARKAGATHDTAFDQAVDATYKGHFDYSSGNRPRIMQGNVAKVLLLFKQFGQNMIYTLARQTFQSIKGATETERKEARKSLGAILAMHVAFAGALGLPMVGMLLSLASWAGGDDDDPWDAEVGLRNYLAEAFGPTFSNLLMKGAPRALTPLDMSGRVGINNLLLPDVQEGLEGKRWAESAMAGALGPVAGIGTNLVKGGQEIIEGQALRGIETMLPVFLKNFAKTYRYADEGVQDKTGISIMDEVSSMDLLVQGMGFSPSDVRTSNEGKSAIYQMNRRLNERRSRLMTLWSRARMIDDQNEMDKIWDEIQGFNEKNPSRRITRMNLNQSYRNRQRRIDRAEDGIYLSRNRQDAREAGRFAFGE